LGRQEYKQIVYNRLAAGAADLLDLVVDEVEYTRPVRFVYLDFDFVAMIRDVGWGSVRFQSEENLAVEGLVGYDRCADIALVGCFGDLLTRKLSGQLRR
jgi:hypothetical protein